jgi:nucleotide-binding universal stress UspA family protein
MEHILLVMDGTKRDLSTLDFACYLAGVTHSKITALFGAHIEESEIPVRKELFALPYVETIVASDIRENREIMKSVEDNQIWFEEACGNRSVNCHIRRNLKISVSDIIKESRFADVLIVSPETSIPYRNDGSPTDFVREILAAAECPVILSPYSFDGISEIVFPYDGSEASIFAIKQFMHIFPELNSKTVYLIQVDQKPGQPIKENDRIVALLTSHYSNVKFVHLTGDPENELFNFLLLKKEMFVVMGAFGRNAISSFIRRSTAELSLRLINLPFFVAHNI